MYSAIYMLNFKYGNVVPILVVLESMLFGSALYGSVIFRVGVCLILYMYFTVLIHIVYICLSTVYWLSFVGI